MNDAEVKAAVADRKRRRIRLELLLLLLSSSICLPMLFSKRIDLSAAERAPELPALRPWSGGTELTGREAGTPPTGAPRHTDPAFVAGRGDASGEVGGLRDGGPGLKQADETLASDTPMRSVGPSGYFGTAPRLGARPLLADAAAFLVPTAGEGSGGPGFASVATPGGVASAALSGAGGIAMQPVLSP